MLRRRRVLQAQQEKIQREAEATAGMCVHTEHLDGEEAEDPAQREKEADGKSHTDRRRSGDVMVIENGGFLVHGCPKNY